MLSHGRFVLVASSLGEGGTSGTAVRYRADGAVDRRYGKGGSAEIAFPGQINAGVRSFVTTQDGRVLAAVSFQEANRAERFGVVGLRPNGGLDRAFGKGGGAPTQFAGENKLVGIVRSGRKKVTVVGYSYPEQSSLTILTDLAQLTLKGKPVR
jgi:hypothetical protein